jgi:hypothetical protein
MVEIGTVQYPDATIRCYVAKEFANAMTKRNPIATNSWLLEKILQRKKSLMQPILGCNKKYGNKSKRKCNQFLVVRLNIATITLVDSGYIATKH